jgi:N-acetylglucosaminyl-diphospho-decaprenol L-rhamnosyltransferase
MSSHQAYEIVVVAYRSRRPLEDLLASLPGTRIIVVDNSSDLEDLSDLMARHPQVTYLDSGGNLGFAAAANLGASAVSRPVVVFLNPDARPDGELLASLVRQVQSNAQWAACAPALVGEDGRLQVDAGGWEPNLPRAAVHALGLHRLSPTRGIWAIPRNGRNLEVGWLSGACLAVRREALLEVGGFDSNYFLYNSDMDLGRRLRERGYRQLLRGDLRVPHVGGGSSDIRPTALWARRGSGLAEYLQRTKGPVGARLIKTVLTLGLAGRAAFYALTARRRRTAEMLAYARSLWAMP